MTTASENLCMNII